MSGAALILEATVEGIVSVDRDGLCDVANPSACRILGCQPSDLIGRSFHDFVHPRHACEPWPHAKTLCPLGGLLEMQIAASFEDELFVRGDGTTVPVQFAGSTLPDGGAVVTFSDVTESKALQSELERDNRMAGLGHVAGTIAHEFNNVLMGIQPFLDLMIRRAAGRADLAEPISRIADSVQRGKRIALEILRFSHPTAVKLEPFSLQPWLGEVARDAAALLGPTHEVELDLPPEPLVVRGDRDLLRQVFANLVANARDAMTEPGTLRIAAERFAPHGRFGGKLRIAVSDTGQGMSAETLKHAFEPLFTTKKGRGTGLGLAIVHRIVTAHGGTVFAESEPGRGATFILFLEAA